MTYVAQKGLSRKAARKHPQIALEAPLTIGGKAIKARRPHWSASLCNVAAELAGIGREARHV